VTAVASRKKRGAETERAVAEAWRGDGWPHAEVVRGQGADLTGTPGLAVEVKARREFRPLEWMRQAAADGRGGLPIVVVRPDGAGPATVDDWPAIVPHHVLRQLLRLAGYGSEVG
jgi:hypothetical protein